jgi:threonine dehydrogenase-like Zn-dependent dehydrogenase
MFLGENYAGLTIVPSRQIIHKEITLHGAFYFTPSDVPEIIDMYRKGMNPSALISHKVCIDDAPVAVEEFFFGNTGKVIILPHEA